MWSFSVVATFGSILFFAASSSHAFIVASNEGLSNDCLKYSFECSLLGTFGLPSLSFTAKIPVLLSRILSNGGLSCNSCKYLSSNGCLTIFSLPKSGLAADDILSLIPLTFTTSSGSPRTSSILLIKSSDFAVPAFPDITFLSPPNILK